MFGGTATETTDYSSDVSSPVEIPAGQSSISVTITPVDDADKENPETISVNKTALLTINPEPWTPALVPTVAWYDAADTATIIESGGLVSQWSDKSGNSNHATQPTSGSQPTYSSARLKATTPTTSLFGNQTLQSRVHTGTTMEMYSNGVEVLNTDSNFEASPLPLTAQLFGQHADYTLYEVVFLPDADVATRQKVEGYLAHKWDTALPAGHPYANAAPVASYVSVSLADANVTDADANDTLTATWSVVNKVPAEAANPIFGDASLVNTTATFIQAGTYTLRLTADDGADSVSEDVVITVSTLPAEYAAWSSGGDFANPFTDTALNANPDGDSSSNLMEFAFGTDPTLSDANAVTSDGSTHGTPMMQAGTTAGTYEF